MAMLMAKALFSMLTETLTKVIGCTQKLTVMEPTQTNLELLIKDNGTKTCSMVRAWKSGLTEATTKESTALARKKELAAMFGLMNLSTEENGSKTRLPDSESISGKMAANFMASGCKIICTALASTSGLTGAPSTGSSRTTRRKVLGYTIGKMADATKAGGIKENSMAWENTSFLLRRQRNMGFGRTAKELSGSLNKLKSSLVSGLLTTLTSLRMKKVRIMSDLRQILSRHQNLK